MIELNRIYNENCLETMERMDEGLVDVVLTSPPYNTAVKANSRVNTLTVKEKKYGYTYARYDGYDDSISNEQYCDFISQLFRKFGRILKSNGVILWNASYGNNNADALFKALNTIIDEGFSIADVICWKKKNALPNVVSKNKATRICEFVFVICRKDEFMSFQCNKDRIGFRTDGQAMYKHFFNFIEAKNNDGHNKLNKAAFSSEFVTKLLNIYAKENAIIYDPFMGTGTTAVACSKLGFDFIGSELSENQCRYANERIEKENLQCSIFV